MEEEEEENIYLEKPIVHEDVNNDKVLENLPPLNNHDSVNQGVMPHLFLEKKNSGKKNIKTMEE